MDASVENPFYHRGPIKSAAHFFGRRQETRRILQMAQSGGCISIVGPAHIGKTSLLFHLCDVEVRLSHNLDPQRTFFVYIDGQRLRELSQEEVLRFLLEETALQVNPSLINFPIVESQYAFEQTIKAWIQNDRQIVYLFDEFECLSANPNLSEDFFAFLRSLNALYGIAYVTSSQLSLLDLVNQEGELISPFFNIFMPVHIGLFTSSEAQSLIRQPAQAIGEPLPHELEAFILDLAGLHPFFLQVACFHAFDLWCETAAFDVSVREELEARVYEDLAPHFKYALSKLTKEERQALAKLLHSEVIHTSPSVLRNLKQKCLVVRSEGGYRLFSKAFEHFVMQELGNSWSQAVQDGKRQLVTVLFVDVVQYTPMTASHQPEEILKIIKGAQRIFVDVVSQYNGYVTSFGGDSVMALFGVPEVRPDDAIRAGNAALEIQDRIAVYAQTLKESKRIEDFAVRVGLDTGPVVLGAIGNAQRSEFTALGDAVNLASRLQGHPDTDPGTVVISSHTYQQVRGYFTVKTLGDWEVKGKVRPVKVYQILGVKKR